MGIIDNPFDSYYEEFIYKSRYSRWLADENRRENWDETVNRYLSFMEKHLLGKHNYQIPQSLHDQLYESIYNLDVMPSMRALMTAGPALDKSNVAGYNCAYLPVDDVKSFDEAMFILMNGTGVGFSVERQYINKLPIIPDELFESDTTIVVADSRAGWAKGLRQLIALLYSGEIPKWDLSKLRPAGAKLKTFGGRSSGPEPLDKLFRFIVDIFKNAAGRKLTSLECHDIMCMIGQVVVVGGVRRSAMISLSNLSDDRMRQAKAGQWWEYNSHRSLANNSAVYTEKPDVGTHMREWTSIYDSKSGERGMYNREAAANKVASIGRRDSNYEWGTNPCSEIILRPYQFCNLTEVVVKSTDKIEDLYRKVGIAAILGTFQSTLTDFPYLRKVWQNNTEEERLLGVSLTGIMDNPITNGDIDEDAGLAFEYTGDEDRTLKDVLTELRITAIATNGLYADDIGITPSTAITCVKPSGTVSQLVNSASGIHTRYAPYYIRTVRADNKDPLTAFLKDVGVPNEPDLMNKDDVTIFSFPVHSPETSKFRDDFTAVEQLEFWSVYNENWCEHKPSVTIQVKEHEWPEVGAWVYNNFDSLSGVSFLPYDSGTYQQAPYQECSKDDYEALLELMPDSIDWTLLANYEKEDTTVGMSTYACSGDSCDIVDLTSK